MKEGLIVGAGTAGIITSLFTGNRMIDSNPLGELSLPFSPGIRIFKWDVEVVQFISFFLAKMYPEFSIKRETLKVGYKTKDGIVDYLTEEFKRDYSMITRGKSEYERSFLSSGQNVIPYISINDLGYEGSYVFFFKSALEYLKSNDRLIEDKVDAIEFGSRNVICGEKRYTYTTLYSTIKRPILDKLMNKDSGEDFSTTKKSFYKTSKIATNKMGDYAYIYSIVDEWTRKTMFENYYVYETTKPIKCKFFEKENEITNRFEDIPLQIQKSLSKRTYFGIELIGRYAEWNHSIKANEVIKRFTQKLRYKIDG